MEEKTTHTPEEKTSPPGPKLSSRFENFWYHYKWHSIVALFLVFVIVICSIQTCSKTTYDLYVVYAGSHEIKRTNEGGDFSPYAKFKGALESVTPDFDENGTSYVNLKDLYMLSSDEMKLEPDYNATLTNQNNATFKDLMYVSDYYVFIISKALYDTYKTIDGVEMFCPLAKYVNEGTDVEFYTDSAILLSSTGFFSLADVSSVFKKNSSSKLPDPKDDLVICLRRASGISMGTNKKATKRNFSRSETVIRNILNY